MIWPKYSEERMATGVRVGDRADGSESAGQFRAKREWPEGLKSVYEEAWMKPMFEALVEEMDGVLTGTDAGGAPSARWLRTLREALGEEIRNLRSMEIMQMRVLPKIAQAAAGGGVRQFFEEMEEQAKEQAQRVDEVAELMNLALAERHCVMMEGLVMGIREVIAENQAGRARDGSLLAAALKVQEYKAGCYGCARTFAYILGLGEVSALLEASAQEAVTAQMKLSKLAELTKSDSSRADWVVAGHGWQRGADRVETKE
jgi:ferritin-like metal-binding protein YciE